MWFLKTDTDLRCVYPKWLTLTLFISSMCFLLYLWGQLPQFNLVQSHIKWNILQNNLYIYMCVCVCVCVNRVKHLTPAESEILWPWALGKGRGTIPNITRLPIMGCGYDSHRRWDRMNRGGLWTGYNVGRVWGTAAWSKSSFPKTVAK